MCILVVEDQEFDLAYGKVVTLGGWGRKPNIFKHMKESIPCLFPPCESCYQILYLSHHLVESIMIKWGLLWVNHMKTLVVWFFRLVLNGLELFIYALNKPTTMYGCAWLTDYHLALPEWACRGFLLSSLIAFVKDLFGDKQVINKRELINLHFYWFFSSILPFFFL